jgi:hypothetical protein
VAEDVEFAIQWSSGGDRASRQITSGRTELRAFIDAGDMSDWGHHVLAGCSAGDVGLALGETRYDSGERRQIGGPARVGFTQVYGTPGVSACTVLSR